MDVLTQMKSKLEVLQCNSLVLLPNSITILPYPPPTQGDLSPVTHPWSTHRITLNINFADTTFTVIVSLEHPLDFLVITKSLLPMQFLDDQGFPTNYPNTSLLELVRWLVSNLKKFMEIRLLEENEIKSLGTSITHLLNMNIISKDSYELVIVGDRVNLMVKFRPEKDIKLASMKELVKEDKLLNTGGHFFVLKLVFRVDSGAFLPGEFSIVFSSDLSEMLPGLAEFSHPGLDAQSASDLVNYIIQVKETVDKAIMVAVKGWKERAKLLMSLHSIFDGGDFAVAHLDSSTMCTMDLAFRTNIAKNLLKIELSPTYPAVVPKITLFQTSIPVEGASETRGSGEIKERVIKDSEHGLTKDNDEKDFIQFVLKLIGIICDKQ